MRARMWRRHTTQRDHEGRPAQTPVTGLDALVPDAAVGTPSIAPGPGPDAVPTADNDDAPPLEASIARLPVIVPVMAPRAAGVLPDAPAPAPRAPAEQPTFAPAGTQQGQRPVALKRRPRPARHITGRSLLTAALLSLLVVALLSALVATSSQAWGTLASSLWNGMPATGSPTAPPTTTSQPAIPTATVTIPSPPLPSPQGCAPGAPVTATPSFPLLSARGAPGVRGEVALTFDDGPSPVYTSQILAELKAAGAHATFFVIGNRAEKYPALVRAEWLGGNAIGNHTYRHDWMAGTSSTHISATLMTTTRAILAATGDPCVWLFRPPFGAQNWDYRVAAEAAREGLTSVTWDLAGFDWERPGADVIAQRIISRLHSGAVILLHDSAPDTENQNRSQTVAALPLILQAIHAQGYRTVTLPTLLADAGLARPVAAPHTVPRPSRGAPGWPPRQADTGGDVADVGPARSW